MKCKCRNTAILRSPVYGEACAALVGRGKDCVIVDAGCGSDNNLHEIQRHLRKHGIESRTIGIDIDDCDIEVDEFVRGDVRQVKIASAADVVTCRAFLDIFDNTESFSGAVRACAGFIKEDGLLIIDMNECATWQMKIMRRIGVNSGTKIMSKPQALEHAKKCFRKCLQKCPHGWETDWMDAVQVW